MYTRTNTHSQMSTHLHRAWLCGIVFGPLVNHTVQSWSSWQLAPTVTHARPHSSTVDDYLCGIALGPLASYTVVLFATCCVLLSNAADQWIVRVAVGEKGTDGEQDFWNGQSRAPVVLENVQADHPLAVDVAVVDTCAENYLQNYRTRKERKS